MTFVQSVIFYYLRVFGSRSFKFEILLNSSGKRNQSSLFVDTIFKTISVYLVVIVNDTIYYS